MTPGSAATSTRVPGHVVVVGSGSAGRRHVAAFRAALPSARITVVRRADSTQPTDTAAAADAVTLSDMAAAVADGVSIGVVAGPATHHAAVAGQLLDAGADLLVEKPLTDDPGSAAHLLAHAAATGRSMVVGYHLRLSDTVPALRAALAGGAVGTPTWFDLRVGQHLSTWRPGTDPARSVTARADLGGGVLLELSHELDGLRYLLGDVAEVEEAVLDHRGAPTDGVVDTVADLRLRTVSGATGTVHLDMVSDPPERIWRVGGADGELVADLLAGTVTRVAAGTSTREVLHAAGPGERDRAEERLVAHFLDVHAGRAEPVCTGADGLAAVEIAAAARRSAATGRPGPVPPTRTAAVAP